MVYIRSRIFYGWVIVGTCWSTLMVSSVMNPVVFSVFVDPMRKELDIGLGTIAWAMSIRMISGGVVTPIIGRVIDKYGARWLGCFSGFLAGGSLIGLYFVQDLWLLYGLAAIGGMSGMAVAGAGQLLTVVPVSNWFIAKRGRAIAIATTGMGIGTMISAPLALFMISEIGWRLTWLIFGLVVWIVVIPGFSIFMRRRPEDMGLVPDGLNPEDSSELNNDLDKRNMNSEVNWTVGQAMRTQVLWLILLSLGIYAFCSAGILFLRVPFWNEIGIPTTMIGIGIAIDPFTVIFAILFFGFLAERYPIRFMAMIGGVWRALSMIPLILVGGNSYSVILHNFVWGVGSGAFSISQNLIIPTYFGRYSQGSIGGIILPLTIIAGALGAPALGYLIDAGLSTVTVWKIGCVFMLAAGLLFFFLKPPKLNIDNSNEPSEFS